MAEREPKSVTEFRRFLTVAPTADAVDSALWPIALVRARWIVFWERIWPPLAAIATVAGLFLVVSWLGLWLMLPALGPDRRYHRICRPARRRRLAAPARCGFRASMTALRGVDHASGLPHRPATAIADNIATAKDDPWSLALWRAHVERALTSARNLTAGKPAPHVAARDPVAIRALVLILVSRRSSPRAATAPGVSSPPSTGRATSVPADFRLDAWVSPPQYTGKPPVILPGIRPGETAQAQQQPAAISVPAGSVLVVRSSGKAKFDIVTGGGLETAKTADAPQLPSQTDEQRFTIKERGTATVRGVGNDIVWSFNAIPDKAPTIELTKDPEPQARGAVQFTYKMEDDYGVDRCAGDVCAQAGNAPSPPMPPRPLYAAPDVQLVLPQPRTRNGVGQTMKDLSEHPWSGADVLGHAHRARRGRQRRPQRRHRIPAAAAACSPSRWRRR